MLSGARIRTVTGLSALIVAFVGGCGGLVSSDGQAEDPLSSCAASTVDQSLLAPNLNVGVWIVPENPNNAHATFTAGRTGTLTGIELELRTSGVYTGTESYFDLTLYNSRGALIGTGKVPVRNITDTGPWGK